jgi:surface carbohydrate biosynthesis protein
MNALDAVNITYAQQAGHLTACLNEEFFGLKPEKWLYETEIHEAALENIDLICAQGEAQAKAYYAACPIADVRITGNGRALYRVGTRGHEILIPTMAGTINSVMPFHEYMATCFRIFGAAGENEQRLMREQIEHESHNLPLMLAAIEEICASNPDHTVRVRPHPSEDPSLYEAVVKRHANAILDDRTPFSERLRDARIVVFISGCGTGLEAALAGVPAIRVGSGGHGISEQLGAPYRPGIVAEFIRGRVAAQPQDLTRHFAPCTLPEVLDDFARERHMNIKIGLESVMASRETEFKPVPFMENKWPDVPDARMAELTGLNVKRVGWRLWAL